MNSYSPDGGDASPPVLIVTLTPTVIVTDAPEDKGLVHPAVGYLVCFAVIAVFAIAIGVICFRHYRKKGLHGKMLSLPVDEENLVSFRNGPDDMPKSDEPVKTVVLKRNGKKNDKADDSEDTPMLGAFQASESLSESIEVELLKYTKKTDELPVQDNNIPDKRGDLPLITIECDKQTTADVTRDSDVTAAAAAADTDSPFQSNVPGEDDNSSSHSPVIFTVDNPAPINDVIVDGESPVTSQEESPTPPSRDFTDDEPVQPRLGTMNEERETLTESQVLEMLDDAEEEVLGDEVDLSPEVTSSEVHVTSADVHAAIDDVTNDNLSPFVRLSALSETEEPPQSPLANKQSQDTDEQSANQTSGDNNTGLQNGGGSLNNGDELQIDENKNSNNCNTYL